MIIGCVDSATDQCNQMHTNEPAVFKISCGSTELTTVALSGVCSSALDGGTIQTNPRGASSISIFADAPGACDIDLIFSDGHVVSNHVMFRSMQSQNACRGGLNDRYTVPSTALFNVNTCGDAATF
jgi:hypothetical protein